MGFKDIKIMFVCVCVMTKECRRTVDVGQTHSHIHSQCAKWDFCTDGTTALNILRTQYPTSPYTVAEQKPTAMEGKSFQCLLNGSFMVYRGHVCGG